MTDTYTLHFRELAGETTILDAEEFLETKLKWATSQISDFFNGNFWITLKDEAKANKFEEALKKGGIVIDRKVKLSPENVKLYHVYEKLERVEELLEKQAQQETSKDFPAPSINTEALTNAVNSVAKKAGHDLAAQQANFVPGERPTGFNWLAFLFAPFYAAGYGNWAWAVAAGAVWSVLPLALVLGIIFGLKANALLPVKQVPFNWPNAIFAIVGVTLWGFILLELIAPWMQSFGT